MEIANLVFQALTALAAVSAVLIAWKQLKGMRDEAIKDRTLNICFAYDTDPVLSEVVLKFRKNDGSLDPSEDCTLLNYFDVIAIGVAQGNYDWEITYHQFKNIIPKVVAKLRTDRFEDDYPDLQAFKARIEKRISEEHCVKST